MKTSSRILGLVLVLALVFSSLSIFSLSAAAIVDVELTATYAALCEIGETEEFHIKGTIEDFQIPFAAGPISVPFTADAKGDSLAIEAKVSFLTFRAVCLDGKMYILIPLLRVCAVYSYDEKSNDKIGIFALAAINVLDRIYNEHTYMAQDFYVGETSQSEGFLGGTYAMEEIIENTPSPSFRANIYFDSADKTIKGAKLNVSGQTFKISISELSNQADESVIKTPVGYIDMSLIVMFLARIFLASLV